MKLHAHRDSLGKIDFSSRTYWAGSPGNAVSQQCCLFSPGLNEDFVTVILAEFAPGEVRIVNCGHHPPVKLAAGGGSLQVMAPDGFSPPLGLHPRPARQGIELKPGDRLLFYTDGLVETRDRAGRFFDLDHRVAAALALPDLGTAVKRVVRLLLEHSGNGLADDVLLVLGEPRRPRHSACVTSA